MQLQPWWLGLVRCGSVTRRTGGMAVAALVLLLYFVGSAGAAQPVASGEYLGECCGGEYYYRYTVVARLRLESDGRTLIGGRRGSYVGCHQDGSLLALRPRQSVRIQPDGRFSFRGPMRAATPAIGQTRRFSFRVRGRFTSSDTARVVYSVRPRRPEVFGCVVGPRVLRLHRDTGAPPFIGCASQPGKTVLSSSEARVFEQRRVFYWAFLPYVYGCMHASDKRFAFGFDGFDESGIGQQLDHFRLAGPYVAYGCGGNWIRACDGVRVVDLRDGVLRLPQMPSLDWWPSDIELKDNGSVAWIVSEQQPEGSRHVGVLDTAGQRLLDSGTGIEPDSLTLTGSTLSWLRNGEVRSATLD